MAIDRTPAVSIIGVAIQSEPNESKALLDDLDIAFRNGIDVQNAVGEALGVEILPVTFVIDENSIVVAQLVGEAPATEIAGVIESALR